MANDASDPGIEVVELLPESKLLLVEGVGRVPVDRIKEVEYYPNGAVRAVRFWDGNAKRGRKSKEEADE